MTLAYIPPAKIATSIEYFYHLVFLTIARSSPTHISFDYTGGFKNTYTCVF